MLYFNAGQLAVEFECQVLRRTVAARTAVEHAGFAECTELAQRFDRQIRIHHRHQRQRGEYRHRLKILQQIVRCRGKQRDVDGMRDGDRQPGIAVGRRFGRHHDAYHRVAARAVVDHHRLFEGVGGLLGDDARHHVADAAGRKGHDVAYGFGRKGLGTDRRTAANDEYECGHNEKRALHVVLP